MNRLYTQFQYSLERKVVHLYAEFAVGAVGAPTLDAAGSKGIAAVTRTGTGQYRIRLQDRYVGLLHAVPVIVLASGTPAAVGGMVVRAASVSASTPVVDVEFVNNAGAAVELNNGATVHLKLDLKATTV